MRRSAATRRRSRLEQRVGLAAAAAWRCRRRWRRSAASRNGRAMSSRSSFGRASAPWPMSLHAPLGQRVHLGEGGRRELELGLEAARAPPPGPRACPRSTSPCRAMVRGNCWYSHRPMIAAARHDHHRPVGVDGHAVQLERRVVGDEQRAHEAQVDVHVEPGAHRPAALQERDPLARRVEDDADDDHPRAHPAERVPHAPRGTEQGVQRRVGPLPQRQQVVAPGPREVAEHRGAGEDGEPR